jgi:hypothetical protein
VGNSDLGHAGDRHEARRASLADPSGTVVSAPASPVEPAHARNRLTGRGPSAVVHVALAVASFSLVAAGIERLTPWPVEDGLRAKVEYFLAHRDEFDTLYLGSSLTFRGVIPPLADAQLGGGRTSFNLGVAGMNFYERGYLVDEVLATRPARLQMVVMEAMSTDPQVLFEADGLDEREVHWHSWKETARVLEGLRSADLPWRQELSLAWMHVEMALRKHTSYARGFAIARALIGDEEQLYDYLEPADLEVQRGYQDSGAGHNDIEREARQNFLAQIPDYAKTLRAMDAANGAPSRFTPSQLELVLGQHEQVQSLGVEVVCLVLPMARSAPEFLRAHEDGQLPLLIAFNSPNTYPDLYRVDQRWDRAHLNRRGAEILSRLLATELARLREPVRVPR